MEETTSVEPQPQEPGTGTAAPPIGAETATPSPFGEGAVVASVA